jgi:hypothetical protein
MARIEGSTHRRGLGSRGRGGVDRGCSSGLLRGVRRGRGRGAGRRGRRGFVGGVSRRGGGGLLWHRARENPCERREERERLTVVGPAVGSLVGASVGAGVGYAVGLSVGLAVGSDVGAAVGDCVKGEGARRPGLAALYRCWRGVPMWGTRSGRPWARWWATRWAPDEGDGMRAWADPSDTCRGPRCWARRAYVRGGGGRRGRGLQGWGRRRSLDNIAQTWHRCVSQPLT